MSRPAQADNLVKSGLLHEEPSDKRQVAAFLNEANELLATAKIEQVPGGVRYRNAYDAAFAFAMAALRNLGLRPSQKEGSRNITIGSLAWTLDATAEETRVLMQANARRLERTYRAGSMNASKPEIEALVAVVQRIAESATQSLQAK